MTNAAVKEDRYIFHAIYHGRVVRTQYFETLEAVQNFSRAAVPSKYGVEVWHKGHIVFSLPMFLPECGN